MPKRKITLEEAFAVFEQHGLQVEVKAVAVDSVDKDQPTLADFLDDANSNKHSMDYTQYPPVPKQRANNRTQITLHAKHTVGCGGVMVVGDDGKPHPQQQGVETYGPGVCTVPDELAAHLLYADQQAKQADANFADRTFKQYIVVPRRTNTGMVNAAILQDDNYDMGQFFGDEPNANMYIIR